MSIYQQLTIQLRIILLVFFLSIGHLVANAQCSAKFKATPNHADTTCYFINQSSGGMSHYYWDFGDGNFFMETEKNNHTHKYALPGRYTVTLTIYDSLGIIYCTDVYTQDVIITDTSANSCWAGFDYTIDNDSAITLFDTSTGRFHYAQWITGEHKMVTGAKGTQYTFEEKGNYVIKQKILDTISGKIDDTEEFIIFSDTFPGVYFNIKSIDSINNEVEFNNQSTGNATKYFWDFGDGTTSNKESPLHRYNHPGLYDVTLTVRFLTGEKNETVRTYKKPLLVNSQYTNIADYRWYNHPGNEKLYLFNRSQTANNSTFQWDLGDGIKLTDTNFVHTYSKSGYYDVTLKTSSQGVSGLSHKYTRVGENNHANPGFYYMPDNDNTVDFYSKAWNENTEYYWDFGDGSSIDTNANPSHQYSSSGLYTVYLKTTVQNISNHYIAMINVNADTTKVFTDFKYFVPPVFEKENNKTKYKGAVSRSICRSIWNFGDGTIDSIAFAPTHVFTDTGTYNVCFTVYNDLTGDTNSTCRTMHIDNIKAATWTGNESTSWSNKKNWNIDQVPGKSLEVIIPATVANPPVINSTGNYCDALTIEYGAELTIAPTNDLTVEGDLVNYGNLTLESNSSGTASIITKGKITGSGQNIVNLYLTSQRWWYVSSPVAGETSQVFDTDDDNLLYWWNETNNGTHGWNQVISETILNPLQGYAYKKNTTGATTKQFTGKLNSGNYGGSNNFTAMGATYKGYNLIGNPFPSPVNLDTLPGLTGITLTNIEPTVWFRKDGSFATYNWTTGTGQNDATAIVPNMQGFWIKVEEGYESGGIQITNEARTHQKPHGIYKNSGEDNILRLQISTGNQINDEAVIGFYHGASGVLDDFDSKKMFAGSTGHPEIYSMVDGQELAINGYSKFNSKNIAIPIGARSKEEVDITFAAKNIEQFKPYPFVYLHDKATGIITDLKKQPSYSTILNTGVTNTRFVLKLRNSTIGTEHQKATETQIYNHGNTIFIKHGKVGGKVNVYDILGNLIFKGNIDNTEGIYRIDMNNKKGTFIVKFISSNETITNKVIIQ